MICTLQYLLVWVMCGSKHLYSSAYVICHPLFLQLMKKKLCSQSTLLLHK